MNDYSIFSRTMSAIVLVVGIASAALAAEPTENGRESGSLVNVADFAKLKDEISTSQQAAQQIVDASPVATGREKLNSMNDDLDSGQDAEASQRFSEEMAAGRGPEFWHKQAVECGAHEAKLLSQFDQLQRFYREARRSRPNGKADGTPDKLDELARSLTDGRGAVASDRLRSMLAAAKKERDDAMKEFVGKYRFAAVYQADSAASLPVDVIEEIMIGVVEQAVAMGDAKASAQRAESFMLAFPDEIRRRAKQKAAGQTPKLTPGTRKLF